MPRFSGLKLNDYSCAPEFCFDLAIGRTFFYPQTLRFLARIRLPWQAFKRLCSGRAAIERDDLAG